VAARANPFICSPAATARTHRRPPGQLRLGRRRERTLLVAQVHALDVGTPDRVDHRVEAVTDHAVHALDASLPEYVDQLPSRRRFAHPELLAPYPNP
jgi:hypothetical protein